MPIDEMQSLYEGQSLDLHWTYNSVCPSIPEYLKMVDKSMLSVSRADPVFELTVLETGGLFRLLCRLMIACSTVGFDKDINDLTVLFGRLFQIRDDYQNLMSVEVRHISTVAMSITDKSLSTVHSAEGVLRGP
jgi:geranylgeranyl pyrophosphate synthase